MTALELLDLRSDISPAARRKATQSVDDLKVRLDELAANVANLEESLDDVRRSEDDPVVRVLLSQELIQDLSKARSEWCRAATALERAVVGVDRIDALAVVYRGEVSHVVRR